MHADVAAAGLDGPALQRRLDAALAGVERSRTVVAYSASAVDSFAAVGAAQPRAEDAASTFALGCVTKLLLGALVSEAVETGLLGADDAIPPLLGPLPNANVVAGTTVRHLLEHTHGLDDTAVEHVPMRAGARVDAGALLERLARCRYAAPGALYSYSNAGAWLLAAVLEAVREQPFERQLRERLLAPLGTGPRRHVPSLVPGQPDGVCPAMGATLALSAAELLTFLKAQLDADGGAWRLSAAAAPDRVTALAGWNPFERGVYFGWKSHGSGWLGHDSTWPGASLLVRVRPRDAVALVVASKDHPAALVAAKVLGDVLPELRPRAIPKPLAPNRAAELDLERYCGRYGSAAERFSVGVEPGRALRLTGDAFSTSLVPAANDVFFARPPAPGPRAYVQFLGATGSTYAYLWDGRRVLRRLPSAARPSRSRRGGIGLRA